MIQYGFIFDINKCTGCNACQIACILENELEFDSSWRQVITYNEHKHPDFSFFHLSLACNHCADPPCMKYCPASAYSKDNTFGSVQILPDKCIGCNYCAWVCPYDAPEYDKKQRIMHKCTLCQSRLEENLIPACITLCPTDALQLGIFEHKNIITDISGFTATTIGPSIKIKPLRKGQELPEQSALPFDSEISEKFRSVHKSQADKVNLKNEWPLVTFTILMPLLYGLFTLSVLNKSFLPSGIISIAGIIGFALSALHLGKPLRAFRAIFNIRSSWLSREILGYSVFLFLIFTKELQLINNHFFDLTVILIGAFTLISTDIVYTVIPQTRINRWHSALVFPTGLLYLALFSEYLGLLFFILGIKLYLFLYRKKHYNKILSVLSLFRIGLGFVVPVILVILNPTDVIMLMFVFVILAEILDRFDFYLELDIITPKKQMQLDYDKNFRTLTSGNN